MAKARSLHILWQSGALKISLSMAVFGFAMPYSIAKAHPNDSVALARLDGYATALTDAEVFSGVVLVAHNGQILFERAYGKRDPMAEEGVELQTRFNIASAGKMFTATAVLQLIAAGKLSLDTTVGEVITDYPNRTFAETVTVRQLLTHTAGAGDVDLFGADKAEIRKAARTHADMVALHWQRAPEFTPGTSQKYGNFGHVVLGRIVEIISGSDYESYLRDNVFKPAGMTETDAAACADDRHDKAVGYVNINGTSARNCVTQPVKGFAAGGQYSTARDLLKFVEAARNGRLLPIELFNQAISVQREYMGLGFFATDYGEGVPERDFRWGHGGSSDGACADVRTYPVTGETIIILSNRDAPACFRIAALLHRSFQDRGPLP